ncbi:gliding motility-associated C-terminal domain-containing protein [Mesonia sp. K7]|uniref:gliding motility-associated C-terminal domain-containing protein n=1 Tax=Mesonia sp. K7 TaxID=2218606 RepID=UPI000DA9F0E8|nr:gliding motility-associated C-terminal domain-containing protein [Mesonia sp. K7]PZD78088.1 gliding motility-associated C-terminal domain-containing protein [Mesonia sp. K7]
MFSQTVNTGVMYVSENTTFSTVKEFNNTNTGTFYNDGDSYIYSHFNNDGIVDYVDGDGLTRFIGTSIQQITGLNTLYFYNVLFNNTSTQVPFELHNKISIANIGDFTNGIVNNEDYGGLFIFENNATHLNVSDYSHVDGYVLKNGDAEFKYPIGDGGYYRFATIGETENTANIFQGKYFLQNSDLNYPHENKEEKIEFIDDTEYWVIEKKEGSPENIILSLSWNENTTPYTITENPGSDYISIVRWDTATQKWINEGGFVDETEKTVTSLLTGYGVFTLAKIQTPSESAEDHVIYNEFSPNGDGINDTFIIEGIENYPNNKLEVYNRWGNMVYEKRGYDNSWDGISTARATLNINEILPVGTYYYILKLGAHKVTGNIARTKTGWIYINR